MWAVFGTKLPDCVYGVSDRGNDFSVMIFVRKFSAGEYSLLKKNFTSIPEIISEYFRQNVSWEHPLIADHACYSKRNGYAIVCFKMVHYLVLPKLISTDCAFCPGGFTLSSFYLYTLTSGENIYQRNHV